MKECVGECELDILSAFPDHTKQPLNSWGVAFGCLGARDWNRKREASHSHSPILWPFSLPIHSGSGGLSTDDLALVSGSAYNPVQ